MERCVAKSHLYAYRWLQQTMCHEEHCGGSVDRLKLAGSGWRRCLICLRLRSWSKKPGHLRYKRVQRSCGNALREALRISFASWTAKWWRCCTPNGLPASTRWIPRSSWRSPPLTTPMEPCCNSSPSARTPTSLLSTWVSAPWFWRIRQWCCFFLSIPSISPTGKEHGSFQLPKMKGSH